MHIEEKLNAKFILQFRLIVLNINDVYGIESGQKNVSDAFD